MATKAEVAIIGGGAIGFSIAYHLGGQDIPSKVIEMDAIASKASGKAWAAVGSPSGLLTIESELYPEDCLRPCLGLSWESARRFPQLAAELKEEGGVDPQYWEVVRVQIALDEGEEKYLKQRMIDLKDEGFGLRWLGGDEVRAQFRAANLDISPEVRGALVHPHGAVLDSYRYVLALAQAAERRGASIKYGQAVGFRQQRQRVNAVMLASGEEVAAEAVVIAMGPWSAQGVSWLGEEIPLEAVRGSCVRVEVPQRFPPYMLRRPVGSVVPKADGSVIVGYMEEPEVALEDDRVREEIKNRMVEAAVRIVPRLAEARLVEARAGVLGYTGDKLPVLGRLSGWDNVYIAAGLGTLGIHLSPAVGRVMADLVAAGRTLKAVEALSPIRFGL